MSDLSVKDRVRIELTVRRIDSWLEARVPRARRRQIRDELRSNLIEASNEVGPEEAVRQLGDLHELANSYLDLYRGTWDFRAGSYAALLTYTTVQMLSLVISFAFSAGVWASGGHAASYELWSWFGPFSGSTSPHSFAVTLGSPALVVLTAIALVIGSTYRTMLRRVRQTSR
jgi:hypothetical protein